LSRESQRRCRRSPHDSSTGSATPCVPVTTADGPSVISGELARHLEAVKKQHDVDLRQGAGWVELPWALARKYPNAGREWVWQWVFPATRFYVDRVTGQRRRHHLHESVVQRAFKEAVRHAGIPKRDLSHAAPLFRHPPARGRPRHPDGPGTAEASRRQYDHDLYTRPEPRARRGSESSRWDGSMTIRAALLRGSLCPVDILELRSEASAPSSTSAKYGQCKVSGGHRLRPRGRVSLRQVAWSASIRGSSD